MRGERNSSIMVQMTNIPGSRRWIALLAAFGLAAQPAAAAVVKIPSLITAAPYAASAPAATFAPRAFAQGPSTVIAAPAPAGVLPVLPSPLAAESVLAAPAEAPTPQNASSGERAGGAPALEQLHLAAAAWSDRATPAASAEGPAEKPLPVKNRDFGRMFDLTRRLLTRPAVREFLQKAFAAELTISKEEQEKLGLPSKIKELSESQLMLLLALNPDLWPSIEGYLADVEAADKKGGDSEEVSKKWITRFDKILEDEKISEKFKTLNDPTRSMRLEWPDGKPGYTEARLYADHPRLVDGKLAPPEDLKKVLIDFIGGAKSELMFNVFDFDLMDVADAMIAAADRGVKVTGGIYKKNIETRPEVKAVFDKLSAHKNIKMVSVDSVGLNHQKLVIRDFNDRELAASLMSSGNFTQSCIGPEGDLVDVPMDKRDAKTKESVPNANHMVTMKGYLVAQVIADKLIQTLEYGLRGKDYPLGGSFKIYGPKPEGAAEAPYIKLTFSPKGSLGDINRDMIRRLLLETRGALRAMVFAFSSKTVQEAIIERARLETSEGHAFDFKAFGDTPFTMRDYSVLLHLAGLEVDASGKSKQYVEAAANALKEVLGAETYAKLLENIRIAPHAYGEHVAGAQKFNAKIHHKVFISGDSAIVGSSFNPSDNAEHNNEQIMVTNDPSLVRAITQAFDGLYGSTQRSVHEEALRRNERGEVSSDEIDDQYGHDDEQARGRKSPKGKGN